MMEVSTKGRYSVRIMTFLASRPADQVATKIEIAAAEGTSPQYVQQLMRQLGVAGLVSSRRGRRGGFLLARPPESITVASVLRAAEGEVQLVPCRSAASCERSADCPTRPDVDESDRATRGSVPKHHHRAAGERGCRAYERGPLLPNVRRNTGRLKAPLFVVLDGWVG